MNIEVALYLTPLFLGGLLMLSLLAMLWPRRRTPTVAVFIYFLGFAALWSFAYAFELWAGTFDGSLFWKKVKYMGITLIPVLWLTFILHYTGREKWAQRRYMALLSTVPVVCIVGIWTNPLHHLFYATIREGTLGPFTGVVTTGGVLFWLNSVYAYVLIMVGVIILLHSALSAQRIYAWQAAVLSAGIMLPLAANICYVSGNCPFPFDYDLTPSMFVAGGIAIWLSMFRLRFLDVVPIARETLIENIEDAILVLDSHNKIVDVNPVGRDMIRQKLFRLPDQHIIGARIENLFSHRPDLIDRYGDVRSARGEVQLGMEGNPRWYDVTISPLHASTGRYVGRVLTLRDISMRKQAEQRISRLNDGLRLINKIMRHDILNHIQISYSALDLNREEADEELYDTALSHLSQAVEVITRMRELEQLISAGGQLERYNIRETARSALDDHDVQGAVEGDCTVMADEALHSVLENLVGNAVKHGHADTVTVTAEETDEGCEVRVADNGSGIPDNVKERVFEERFSHGASAGTGLGLYLVQLTMQRYGGSVAVEDNQPQGTIVVLRFPHAG
ncbi:MAG: histidine kinase N-terminal 7TM domain-containing protein [Thermoplasmatota archaeon]